MSNSASESLNVSARLDIEHACARLANDYSFLADNRQWQEWSQLFTEDAELVVMGQSYGGRPAIRGMVGDGDAATQTFHSNSNIRIDVVSATEARGVVSATVWVVPIVDGKTETKDLSPALIGRYEDTYKKTQEGWRIRRRAFTALMTKAG